MNLLLVCKGGGAAARIRVSGIRSEGRAQKMERMYSVIDDFIEAIIRIQCSIPY